MTNRDGAAACAEEIGRLLGGRTVAVAESVTAGRVAEALATVTSASSFFRGGVVAYQEQVKRSILGVTAQGMVSSPAAVEMVTGVVKLLDADAGVSTTGVAGDDPVDGKPSGTVFIATFVDAESRVDEYRFPGEPLEVCEAARDSALAALLGHLRSTTVP